MALIGLVGIIGSSPALGGVAERHADPSEYGKATASGIGMTAQLIAAALVIVSAFLGSRLRLPGELRIMRNLLTLQRQKVTYGLPPILAGVVVGWVGGLVLLRGSPMLVEYLVRLPIATRVLFGPLTEEVIFRWGLLASVIWLFSVRTRCRDVLRARVALAVIVTNAVFVAFQLLVVRAWELPHPFELVMTMFLVTLPWGWLVWEYGLVAGITAHLILNVVVELGH